MERKLCRRRNKYVNILSKQEGISVSETQTSIIAVCNRGLVNGLDQDILFETFHNFGELENIVMINGKSYCFVVFKNISDSLRAYESLHNTVIWNSKGPVFLCFTESVPSHHNNELINMFLQPSGLIIIENFITPDEEEELLKCVDFDVYKNHDMNLRHRKVKHFGYEFNYDTNNVDCQSPIEDLPDKTKFLWDKLKLSGSYDTGFVPDQLTINYYRPGQGIPSHVDTHSAFQDEIVSLSLLSDIVMEFSKENVHKKVVLPRRSLCIMSGEARYLWSHGITPRKTDIVLTPSNTLSVCQRQDRVSFTFRKLRKSECNCNYFKTCDTYQLKNKNTNIETSVDLDEVATKLEKEFVIDIYDKIADHFSETRHKPWPNVTNFIKSFPPGSILLDIGCGNGKYFNLAGCCYELGFDSSGSLMRVCYNRGNQCVVSNCLNIPVRDRVADGCVSIAVVHHLATEARRLQALKEMARVLKPGGRGLVYVWAKNQEADNGKSSYLKQRHKKNKNGDAVEASVKLNSRVVLPVHTNRTEFKHKDLFVPWKLKEEGGGFSDTFMRYYHVFEENELRDYVGCIHSVQIVNYYYDQGNWCVMFEKK